MNAYWARPLLVAAGFVAVLCGCGGDDEESPTATEQRDRTSEEIGESSGDAAADTSSGTEGAVVAIGDVTFEFDGFNAPGCVRIGGQISGSSSLGDGSMRLTFTIPPEDWETNEHFDDPPVISLFDARSGPEIRWGSGLGGGQIDSYTIDDGGARGSGTFTSESMGVVEDFISETVDGTFEISCGS